MKKRNFSLSLVLLLAVLLASLALGSVVMLLKFA